jgi:hypothetical protein
LQEVLINLTLAINKQSDTNFLNDLLNTFFDIPHLQIKRTVSDILEDISGVISTNEALLFRSFTYLLENLDNELIISKI